METRKSIITKQLKSLGLKTIFHNEKWLNYQAEGIKSTDLDFLKTLIADENYIIDYGIDGDCSAVHAWRIVGQFKEVSFIPFFLELLFIPENLEADMYLRDFPQIMGMMGDAALNHLIPLLFVFEKKALKIV